MNTPPDLVLDTPASWGQVPFAPAAPAAPSNTSTTPASTTSNYQAPETDPTINDAYAGIGDYYSNLATTPIDEDQIKTDTLNQFQSEIDAVNNVYADQLAAAKAIGAGRLGTQTAVNARRGLLGSDFGNAAYANVENANATGENAIENNKLAAIAGLQDKIYQVAQQQINTKNAARQAGVDSYLNYLNGASDRKKTNAAEAATYILSQGLSINDLSPDQLSQTAQAYGVSVPDIEVAYKTAALKSTKGSGGTSAPQATIAEITKVLNNQNKDSNGYSVRGDDGYVDPYVYADFLHNWLADGYSSTEFFKKFPVKDYVNPSATGIAGVPGIITQQLKSTSDSDVSMFGS